MPIGNSGIQGEDVIIQRWLREKYRSKIIINREDMNTEKRRW
jgi:hypothetical protein